MLEKFNIADAYPVLTPIDPNTKLVPKADKDVSSNVTQYQSIIGSLMYASIGTRPDLAFTLTYLSQFLQLPSVEHLTAAKQVLKYLRRTGDWDILYPYSLDQTLVLEGYVDSLWGACLTSCRLFMWYVFQFGEYTISWKVHKQWSVVTSTTEAEYMAMSLRAKQMMWYSRGLTELRVTDRKGVAVPKALRSDTQGGIDLLNNPRISDRSRHIDIQYHYTRERLMAGDFSLVYVATWENLADICTKALTKDNLSRLSYTIRNCKESNK